MSGDLNFKVRKVGTNASQNHMVNDLFIIGSAGVWVVQQLLLEIC